jgi:ParB family transcriptional regulator, chromosome partitioning protein
MSKNGKLLDAADVPIVRLVPRNERSVSKKYRTRIEASLKAVGLIDPLIVFPLGEDYEILDGCLRYRILLELGVEVIPCLIAQEREAFTGNRMVNRLSQAQEMRMLRKSLETLDEKTIADAFGMTRIKHRLNESLLKKLSPETIKAFEAGKISLECARELAHVKPGRQVEILKFMESSDDYSTLLAKGLVLKTPLSKRAEGNGVKTPWARADEKKQNLLKRLKEAEQQQDFYSGLYRQYTTNLLKLVIFTRSLLASPPRESLPGKELSPATRGV